jgi:hypothetical protein
MNRTDVMAQIERHIAEKGVTRLPAAAVAETTATIPAADRKAVAAHDARPVVASPMHERALRKQIAKEADPAKKQALEDHLRIGWTEPRLRDIAARQSAAARKSVPTAPPETPAPAPVSAPPSLKPAPPAPPAPSAQRAAIQPSEKIMDQPPVSARAPAPTACEPPPIASDIKIEAGIPIPRRFRPVTLKYPFDRLELVDPPQSFFVAGAKAKEVVAQVSKAQRVYGAKYTMRTQSDGVRVWRVG